MASLITGVQILCDASNICYLLFFVNADPGTRVFYRPFVLFEKKLACVPVLQDWNRSNSRCVRICLTISTCTPLRCEQFSPSENSFFLILYPTMATLWEAHKDTIKWRDVDSIKAENGVYTEDPLGELAPPMSYNICVFVAFLPLRILVEPQCLSFLLSLQLQQTM